MDNKVLFSVIIPTYNRGKYLKNAILSVIDQEYENWELIIIDDGSTDNTCQLVSQFQDPRLKYFYKQNEERSIARNFGIQKAIGEYVCFLDSDDVLLPNHLYSLKKEILRNNSPIGLFQSGVSIKSKQTQKVIDWYNGLDRREIVRNILKGKSLYIQGISVSREILTFLQFPRNYSYWEDQHLWLRILCEYPFYQVNDITAIWLINDESSVELIYKKNLIGGLNRYLGCIHDLKNDPIIKKSNWITKKDILSLKVSKASGFIKNQRGNSWLHIMLYLICLKHLGFMASTKMFLSTPLKK